MDKPALSYGPQAQARDYVRVEEAIRFIDANFQDQPSLATIAKAANLSAHHFQRLFTRWAGVSPTRFMHYLTVAYSKSLLDQSWSVLDAALEAGTSGPGRLHDLFVAYEAMTPGQAKRRGDGLTIRHGLHDGPFGRFHILMTERGICGLTFDGDNALEEQKRRWPLATFAADKAGTAGAAAQVFRDKDNPPALHVSGTNFQIKVWEALTAVPPGRVVSYGDLASVVCTPKAARAVGSALSQNPIAFLIPCHRVIRATGVHDAYRWGRTRRQALLGWEAAQEETKRRGAA
ncbi:MAG: methylated-DNA--[protein]-cysteine S-methyltransferase [Rhodospirillales bacterium]|nr:methylated-DNA--[protein]-cysteine S-methyltransferase [Rhodospirillales bacterium]